MAPDPPSRDRPLRADPLVGSTALLDREPAEKPPTVVGAGARLDAARLASSRPSATLPPLSRRADLADWARTTMRGLGRRGSRRSEATSSSSPGHGADGAAPSEPGAPKGEGLLPRLREAPTRPLVEGAALCLVGLGLLLGWVVHVSWTPLLDVGLVVVGAVLVVQARRSGTSRPLLALGIVLAVVAVATWRAGVTLDGGLGRRTETPTAAGAAPLEYRLGTGQLTIDLRETALSSTPLVVDAEVGIGRIVVKVPDDAVVETTAAAGGGHVLAFGERWVGPGLDETSDGATMSTNRIRLDLRVGLGSVEVARG